MYRWAGGTVVPRTTCQQLESRCWQWWSRQRPPAVRGLASSGQHVRTRALNEPSRSSRLLAPTRDFKYKNLLRHYLLWLNACLLFSIAYCLYLISRISIVKVWAFSSHCGTSRRFVDSSSGDCGGMLSVISSWHSDPGYQVTMSPHIWTSAPIRVAVTHILIGAWVLIESMKCNIQHYEKFLSAAQYNISRNVRC